MRKILYILFLFSLFSCTKENDLTMDFKITGANDAKVVRGESIVMPMKVFYLGGELEEVTVSATGLPPGITVNIENPTGEPDFSLTVTFTADIGFTPADIPVTMLMVSESGKQVSKTFTLSVIDPANKLPVIIVAGGVNLTWTLNDPFTDPGYYASDTEDGDLTAQVAVQGHVSHDTAGIYVLTYTVTDSDGESDTATRVVTVLNSLSYMSGLYNCTTEIQGGAVFTWIADISTSPYHNNDFVLNKISDCYGTFADPLRLELIVNGSNITLPPQIEYGLNTTFPSHCPAAYHSVAGSGTLTYNFPYTFVIDYTDLFEDSTGLQHTYIKKDTYVKVL